MPEKITHYIRRTLSTPPHKAIKKVWRLAQRSASVIYRRKRDYRFSSHARAGSSPPGELYRLFPRVDTNSLHSQATWIAAVSRHYLDHRFDLLGSGWVQVKYGMQCHGLEGHLYDSGPSIEPDSKGRWLESIINRSNLAESKRIWAMVDDGYDPIDWQLDFKSGYRYSESVWSYDLMGEHRQFGTVKPGVDIKVPWELARAHHLPQLAWAYALASDEQAGFSPPDIYVREFRNEVLDFIATNPPRFGVNWACTMDVGIRVANWLVAFDLFRAYCAEFDSRFVAEFARSVYEHGLHIVRNLEWYPRGRNNHYISDVVGLLFVAAYLPRTQETDAWLAFAVQELIGEVNVQFHADGSNYETSTVYHRLSSELIAYATALVLGLPEEKKAALSPFPSWYFERLEKMAEFTVHITKPNGSVPQIGDNDSGRFLKLQPAYKTMTVAEAKSLYANLQAYDDLPDEETYWNEDTLDHRHLVAAINGLFGRKDFRDFCKDGCIETEIIRRLAGGTVLRSYLAPGELTAAERVRIGTPDNRIVPDGQKLTVEIPIPGDALLDDLKLYGHPDFGLFIYRSNRLYLLVRCGRIGQDGIGGHVHNDQLSIELNVDGEDWIRDPGTYIYNPLPSRRNEYRSVNAHFAPHHKGSEPMTLDLRLFSVDGATDGNCTYFGEAGFAGEHVDVKLTIGVSARAIRLTASSDSDNITIKGDSTSYSDGYGRLCREPAHTHGIELA